MTLARLVAQASQSNQQWLNLDDLFWMTVLGIFALTIIGALVRTRQRDKCAGVQGRAGEMSGAVSNGALPDR